MAPQQVEPAPPVRPDATAVSRAKRPAEQRAFFDLDGDGDVDGDDLLLGSYWLFRLLELLFDVTLWVIPFGAMVGSALTIAAAIFIESTLRIVQAQLTALFTSFVEIGVLPANFLTDGINSVLGIDLQSVLTVFEIAIGFILVINAMVVANGLYVGLRRASRKAVNFQDDRICGCSPTKLPRWYRSNACQWARRCSNCCAQFGQGLFAIVGECVLWLAIIAAYTGSVVFLLLFLVVTGFRLYCDRVRPYVNKGLAFSAKTLVEVNASLLQAATYTAQASDAWHAVQGNVQAATSAPSAAADGVGGTSCRRVLQSMPTAPAAPGSIPTGGAGTTGASSSEAAASGAAAIAPAGSASADTLISSAGCSAVGSATTKVTSAWSESMQSSNLLFELSPIPDILSMASGYFGLADGYLDTAREMLRESKSYVAFLERLCELTNPLPRAFLKCFVALLVVCVGQIIVSKFHLRYYTVWYYEVAIRRRRRKLKEQISATQEASASMQQHLEHDHARHEAPGPAVQAEALPFHLRAGSRDQGMNDEMAGKPQPEAAEAAAEAAADWGEGAKADGKGRAMVSA